ncbi:MAG: hypothetical protein LUI60_06880 [Clostridia bacterium]|nr:hypothetical protein [Clostridia bacterium]
MTAKKLAKIAMTVVSLVLASSVCMAATCSSDDPSSNVVSSIIDGISESSSDSSSSSSSDSSSSSSSDSNSSSSVDDSSNTDDDSQSDPAESDPSPSIPSLAASQDLLDVSAEINSNGSVDYNYTSGTTLNMNVGYGKNSDMSISFTSSNISGSVVMPDGITYSQGSLKPAWKSLETQLDVTFRDSYTKYDSDQQITSNNYNGTLAIYQVITGQAAAIVNLGTSNTDLFLDLSLYLDYMPNYKKFLQDNPTVYMSLTSNTDTGAMYYAPYFDGNDDIEKYELAKKNWISLILDGTTPSSGTLTFADQATAKATTLSSTNYGLTGTTASCESFMGTVGSWSIQSTSSDGSGTVTITVNYDKALAAANDSNSDLGKALTAAGVTVGNLTSGNIVDLQNEAINTTNGTVTGAQLTDILKAYIDVAYLDNSGNKYYSTRSDVFNGYDAAWDVDLFVALQRCVVTYGNTNLGTATGNAYIYGVTGRQDNTQRMNDMVSLAGELYGVRGLTSRYEYTYIDSNGTLQEARASEDMYTALDNMHDMTKEGLYNVSGKQGNGTNSYYTKADEVEALMGYDYVQTQTANGGFDAMGVTNKTSIEEGYDFEPIVTPVSKWNDGDTSATANTDGIKYSYSGDYKYMRFTESWRSVMNTGFCVPRDSVTNSETLAAVLAFIDYLYSNDGQILMSFGGQSDINNASTSTADYSGNTDTGWWYGTEVTNVSIDTVATMVGGQYYINDDQAANYFCYGNKLYTGTLYNGRQYPTMTNTNLAFYYGYSVNGVSQNSNSGFAATGVCSYSNYARRILGTYLPIGIKLHAFDYQCTATMGKNGADIVAAGLVNGTISHVYQTVDNGKGYWYTNVPTALPYASTISTWISTNETDLEDTVFAKDSAITTNFPVDIIAYGLGAQSNTLAYFSETQTMPDTAAECISLLQNTFELNPYVSYMQAAWADILNYYNNYIA